jgi:hypothetical protein
VGSSKYWHHARSTVARKHPPSPQKTLQVKLDALPPSAAYHRGSSNDEEADDGDDLKKPVATAAH